MPSKRLAKSDSASGRLVARTDGRTNERVSHLNEITHVLNRARDFQADLVTEWEAMVDQLEAERVTHSNESLAEVKRRLQLERPETPYQQMLRRKAEARTTEIRRLEPQHGRL